MSLVEERIFLKWFLGEIVVIVIMKRPLPFCGTVLEALTGDPDDRLGEGDRLLEFI